MKLKLWKAKNKQVKGLECLNCGQPLNGSENFCSYCGQKNTTSKLSFGVFINNIFSGFFHMILVFGKHLHRFFLNPGLFQSNILKAKESDL